MLHLGPRSENSVVSLANEENARGRRESTTRRSKPLGSRCQFASETLPHYQPCHQASDHHVRSAGSTATATEAASGASLLVDVEFRGGRSLYALSQGDWVGDIPSTPAVPNTGALLEVNKDGAFTVITDGLNQPTSLEFIGKTAHVVTFGEESEDRRRPEEVALTTNGSTVFPQQELSAPLPGKLSLAATILRHITGEERRRPE